MEIQKIPISQINPAPYNPRLDLQPGDPDYEKLKKSLEEFDLVEPLIWNKRNGNLIGGHQRLKIFVEQGKTDVDVSVVDLEDSKEKALNLALNKISGDWDLPKLKDLLQELDTGEFDMDITGFDIGEIEDLMTQFYEPDEKDDEVPEVPDEPITKKGDLYKLGEHRLLCGDATKIDDVERLMDGSKADMVFTDPPYNVAIKGKFTGTIKNDSMSELDFIKLLNNSFINLNLFNKGSFYIFYEIKNHSLFQDIINKNIGNIDEIIIWNKDSASFYSRNIYNRKYEAIFYIKSKGLLDCDKETNVWDFAKSSSFNSFDENKKRFNEVGNYLVAHPTTKPVGLISRAINNSSKQLDIILDLFGGSGSTLIACQKLNRKCFMMELDEHYCDVIVKRWEDYTGKKAEMILNG